MPSEKKRPNILFLNSDQHRFDLAGFMGNEIIRTPNLDSLAENGVVFDNCYGASPICVPGRQAMASGKYPCNCNCLSFNSDLEPNYMTFAKRFSQYAYKTITCGKLHHHGIDQNQGWLLRVGQDNEISESHIEGAVKEEFEKYKRPGQWWDWSKEVRKAGVGYSPHHRIDDYAVLGAENVIDEYFCSPFYDHEQNRPIFLNIGLRLPHYPYLIDEKRFNYYLNRVETFYRENSFDHPVVSRDWDKISDDVTEREVRRATAAYYGMIEAMDELYGRVLRRLEDLGQNLDDWIIVYASDHGDMIGEHGIWMKYKYFESSARTPLLIRYPKEFNGKRVKRNTSICDLFATFCELCGIPAPEGLDSRSLVPLMKGNDSKWDNMAVSQLDDTTMIKKDNLKYQYYGENYDEVLFDLERDPNEEINYINDEKYADEIGFFHKKMRDLKS